MLRRTLPLFIVVLLGSAQAQGWFAGVSGGVLTDFRFFSPSVGFQVGGEFSESFGLRATFDPYFGTGFIIGAEALYLYDLPETPAATLYSGGGLDYVSITGLGAFPFIHGTLGLEYRTGPAGIFTELRLYLYIPNVRVGVNFHF